MIKYVKLHDAMGDVYKSNHILTNSHPMMIRIRHNVHLHYEVYIINLKTFESYYLCKVDSLKVAKVMGKGYIKSKYGIVSNKEFRNKTFIKS